MGVVRSKNGWDIWATPYSLVCWMDCCQKNRIFWFLGVRIRVRWIHHIVGPKLNLLDLLAGGSRSHQVEFTVETPTFLVEKIHVKNFVQKAIFRFEIKISGPSFDAQLFSGLILTQAAKVSQKSLPQSQRGP